jgi:shikimate dehydrogenase
MKITASTPLYALLGNPVSQSMSPVLQNGWIKEHGFDGVYVALCIEEANFETVLCGFHHAGLQGANVTTPFKEKAALCTHVLSERSQVTQSVNCLTYSPMGFHGDSTDGGGFIADLNSRAPGWDQKPGQVVLLGAGGAARALLQALVEAGQTDIVIVNRDQNRAAQAANMIHKADVHIATWDALDTILEGASLVINATSAGFKGHNPLAIDFSKTAQECLVYDTIYAPRETAFLAAARLQNRPALDGLGMLVGQGALAFENWFGARPDFMSGLARLEAALAS